MPTDATLHMRPALPEPRKRGGARKGTGPKPADGVTGVRRYQVTLDAESEAWARELGDDDRSVGIRRALAQSRIALQKKGA